MQLLRQSTTVLVSLGPFVDPTDGVTLKTGLAAAMNSGTTGIRISKNGASLTARSANTLPVYDAFGIYPISLSTTDTGTLGLLRVLYAGDATCLPMWRDFIVVPANVYDAWTNGSVFQKVDIAAVNTVAGDAALLSAHVECALTGTVNTAINAATATTISCSDITEATASQYVGKQAWQLTGAGAKQWWGVVTSYSLNTGEGRLTMYPGSPTAEVPVTGNVFFFL
jgi:hypothetical protein